MLIRNFGPLAILTLLTLSACDKGRSAEELLIESAQKLVAADLKDPQSAQFRNMIGSEKARMVCGEVNAKNSAGGYIGFRHVMVVGEVDTVSHSFKLGSSALLEPARPTVGTYDNSRRMTMDSVNQLISDIEAQQTYKKILEALAVCQTVVPQMKQIEEEKPALGKFLDHFR